MNSIKLAPETKAKDNRVNVVDDFCTEGYSLEAARQPFSAADALEINLFAFGKYGSRFTVQTPKAGTRVEPYDESTYSSESFDASTVYAEIDQDALKQFLDSLKRPKDSGIAGKLLAEGAP